PQGAAGPSTAPPSVSDITRLPQLARLHEKARSPVLAPAPFAFLGALRSLFAVAQNRYTARVNTLSDEMIHCGFGAPLAQIDIGLVLPTGGAPIVAVPLDQHEIAWVGAKPRRVRVEGSYLVRSNHGCAEIEVNVPQLLDRLVVPHPGQADELVL